MDLASFEALLTPTGQSALAAAQALQPREVDFLPHFQTLCRQFPQMLARAALETAILRQEAQVKFPPHLAEKLYLTRQALEQATSYQVSAYRARRFANQLAPDYLIDLGCSIGGDTLALSGVAPTVGIDQDALRLRMAHLNLAALSPGHHARVLLLQADLTCPLPLLPGPVSGLFFDPARRSAGRRVFSVRDYQPPLTVIDNWLSDFPALAVKLSPGVRLQELAPYPAEIEFISLNGELKECVLWFGALRTAARRATLLPAGVQLWEDEPRAAQEPPALLHTPQAYLYEPDPAVLRAGLVRQLAEQLGAAQLDARIAYLTTPVQVDSPFARSWQVEAWFPFQLKRLRAYLRQAGIGQVTVKKRGSPLEPQALIRQLRLSGEGERVLVLTHLRGDPIVIVCLPRPVGL